MNSYAAAIQADRDRLARAAKRNIDDVSRTGGDDDDEDERESAWASVFSASQSSAAESAEEARRRKLARKVRGGTGTHFP